MSERPENPYDALERIFHEPNRLAIMSALCAAEDPVAFTELKEQCGLTDGNLSRHLKVLEETGAVRIRKAFVRQKPRTTVELTAKGLARFSDYLEALDRVLRKARDAMPSEAGSTVLTDAPTAARPARA